VIRAVHKYGDLLRATVASASNDHRLGANEAPPAIISVFLGEQLEDVFEQIRTGGAKSSKSKGTLEIGVDTMPKLAKDPGDRNRTSPFAFTGNRFEFRAAGSSQSITGPMVALNTIIAESLDFIASALEASIKAGKPLNTAVTEVLAGIIKDHGAVVFGGDGYSKEWHQEAEKRGLPNLKTTVQALPAFQRPEVMALFEKYKVLTNRELFSRYEIYFEQYCKTVNVESKLVVSMAKTMILPSVIRYERELAETSIALKQAGVTPSTDLLQKIATLGSALEKKIEALEKTMTHHSADGIVKEAAHFSDAVLPAMKEVRDVADTLEGLVARDRWPLPIYEDILYIK
jgi:glutamine synthetase